MVVKEGDEGWIVRTGGNTGATGHHKILRKCIESTYIENLGWDFYVN